MSTLLAYMSDSLIPNLYADTWYNGQNVRLTDWRLKYTTSNKVYVRVGSPRLRLARIKSGIYTQYSGQLTDRKVQLLSFTLQDIS